MRIIRTLSSIAVLILLIACFNYVMLTIGASMKRMRDLGMMNVIGARKGQILRHFISESLILTMIALFLGIILAEQLLPLFNNLAEEDLTFTLYHRWENFLFLLVILVFIVFSTSLYIGIFLLRNNQPVKFLRKELLSLRRHRFARYFVILQYLITIILMICSGIIVKQLHYMLDQDVGFEKEDVVVLPVDFPIQKVMTLKDKLLQQSRIQDVSMSDRNFVSGSSSVGEKNARGEIVTIRFLRIDHDYLETFSLTLLDGRDFNSNEPMEENYNVIVNETFVKAYDLESPVGEVINLESFDIKVTIIGVVKDFHFDSMHDEIQSVMLIIFPFNSIWSVFVRIDNTDIQAALRQIESAWNEVVPEYTYDYSFLADMLEEQYNNENRWSRITAYAAGIAIFLSCLGLLGISGLLVARRVKEVGIRKANGASAGRVLMLLNGDILKWVLVSFILACPIAWYVMNRWLQDFAFRTSISWWIYALAGVAALLIALLTITWQTYRAASMNPVNALRYE
jgi:putative ABC transport system permease protein